MALNQKQVQEWCKNFATLREELDVDRSVNKETYCEILQEVIRDLQEIYDINSAEWSHDD